MSPSPLRTPEGDGAPAAFECETTADGNGNCIYRNLLIGQKCWVHETQAPWGHAILSSSNLVLQQITTITEVTVTVANPGTHRVVVIVCHEGDDTLLSRDVVDGSSTKTSIGSVPSALAAKNVTAQDLCGLGGATFGGPATVTRG